MKKKIFLALGIMALAGAAFGFYLFNKPHQSILNDKPDFVVESAAIINEFETNEDAANKNLMARSLK